MVLSILCITYIYCSFLQMFKHLELLNTVRKASDFLCKDSFYIYIFIHKSNKDDNILKGEQIRRKEKRTISLVEYYSENQFGSL